MKSEAEGGFVKLGIFVNQASSFLYLPHVISYNDNCFKLGAGGSVEQSLF